MAEGSNIGNLFVEIGADIRDFQKKANEVEKRFEGLKNAASKMQNVGAGLTAAVTAPLAGIGLAALKAASDLEETQSKFDTVFKSLKDDVREFAKEQAVALGRGQGDLERYLATLQDTFVPLGFARDQAAEFSKSLVTLGIDLASFNNLSDDQAIADLQTAIVGNVEVMRKYGVVINQTNLEQELLRAGLANSVKEATEAQKAQARLNLILAGTADAQGDAAKTSQSFANRLKNLQARVGDVLEAIGAQLIPVVQPLVDLLANTANKFANLDPGIQKVIIGFAAFAAAVGPVLLAIGTLGQAIPFVLGGFSSLAGIFGAVTVATAPLAAALVGLAGLAYLIIDNWDTLANYIRATFSPVFEQLQGIITTFAQIASNVIDRFSGASQGAFKTLSDFVKSTVFAAFQAIADRISTVLAFIQTLMSAVLAATQGDTKKALKIIANIFIDQFNGIVRTVQEALFSILGSFADFAEFAGFEKVGMKARELGATIIDLEGITVEKFKVQKDAVASFEESISNATEATKKLNEASEAIKTTTAAPTGAGSQAPAEAPAEIPVAPILGMEGGIGTGLDQYISKLGEIKETTSQLNETNTEAEQVLAGVITKLGQGASAAIEAGKGFEGFAKTAGNAIRDLISAMLAESIAAAIRNTLQSPAGKALGPAGVALAGAAGAAASSLFKAVVPSFAKGGIVSGETFARVGEYASARTNPEVIAPLDRLQGMLANQGTDFDYERFEEIQQRNRTVVNVGTRSTSVQRGQMRTEYLGSKMSINA